MIDDWTISRIWEEIENLKVRVRELEEFKSSVEQAKKDAEAKAYWDEMDKLDIEDAKWYREANDLGS